MLQGFIDTYAQFFYWEMWVQVLTDPVSWGLIGYTCHFGRIIISG